jgi:hypothetical protein
MQLQLRSSPTHAYPRLPAAVAATQRPRPSRRRTSERLRSTEVLLLMRERRGVGLRLLL